MTSCTCIICRMFWLSVRLVPKLFGARVILDLHDPMPELMRSIYQLPRNHWLVQLLVWLERWSVAFADLVLTPNTAFRDLFISRRHRPEKIKIVMNSPETNLFDPARFPSDAAPRSEEERFIQTHVSRPYCGTPRP